ncbi:MAG: hypothetical protein C4314_03490, partial [Thermoflexus sp.]
MLNGLREIYVRTRRHPAVATLPPHLVIYDFDAVYAEEATLEAVYERIARTVVDLGRRPEGICYAVPGSPFVGEATVARIRALAAEAGLPVRIVHGLSFIEVALERFSHGTTIATNALLERKGARTAFLATEGFEHLLHLRRQTRAHLYRLCEEHPRPLVSLERCYGVRERMGPAGVIVPLDLSTLPAIEAEAIAVCLLFSFRHPEHEQAVAEELRRRYPEAHVVASHEVAPEFREYERASTTAVDAYLGPVCARYFRSLERSCRQAGLPTPLVMRSSGGVVTVEEAAAHAALVLVSGPAGGAVGAAMVARQAGIDNAISFDMGG